VYPVRVIAVTKHPTFVISVILCRAVALFLLFLLPIIIIVIVAKTEGPIIFDRFRFILLDVKIMGIYPLFDISNNCSMIENTNFVIDQSH
jgi:hypothetical protein